MHMLPDNELLWLPRKGYGFFPAKTDGVYDQSYYDNYCHLAHQEIGDRLREARFQLVKRYLNDTEELLDFGIGSGDFIRSRYANTFGYDIMEPAVEWLRDNEIYRNPWIVSHLTNVSFWDSLEHVEYPQPLLNRISGYVFVTTPIYRNMDHVLKSKHFRPKEHFWYWTEDGLIDWFAEQGFTLVEINWMETLLGREDIGAFVFKRSGYPGFPSADVNGGSPEDSGVHRLPWI